MFRKLFHYQHELMTMKTKMADLRERNESLVYNILPSHVALHFIGDKRNNDVCSVFLKTRFNKIAIQGTPQMAVD